MSKNIQFNNISPLDRLCHIGKFGIGALTYEPFNELELTKTDIALDELASSS